VDFFAKLVMQKMVTPAAKMEMDNRFMVIAAFWMKKHLKNLRF